MVPNHGVASVVVIIHNIVSGVGLRSGNRGRDPGSPRMREGNRNECKGV